MSDPAGAAGMLRMFSAKYPDINNPGIAARADSLERSIN